MPLCGILIQTIHITGSGWDIFLELTVCLIYNVFYYRKTLFLGPEKFIDFSVWKTTNVIGNIWFFNENLFFLFVTFQVNNTDRQKTFFFNFQFSHLVPWYKIHKINKIVPFRPDRSFNLQRGIKL